jgi:hypothetical protein
MAGTQFTVDEIRALINEARPDGAPVLADGPAIITKIYDGTGIAPADQISANHLVTLINKVINDDSLVEAFAEIMGIRTNEAVMSLVNSHNPYTSDEMLDMTIYTGNPDFDRWADNKKSQIEVEIDGPYTMPKEWYFKGLPQQISKALRIKYRYRAKNLGAPGSPPLKLPHWVTAYMLVGYEDGGA